MDCGFSCETVSRLDDPFIRVGKLFDQRFHLVSKVGIRRLFRVTQSVIQGMRLHPDYFAAGIYRDTPDPTSGQ